MNLKYFSLTVLIAFTFLTRVTAQNYQVGVSFFEENVFHTKRNFIKPGFSFNIEKTRKKKIAYGFEVSRNKPYESTVSCLGVLKVTPDTSRPQTGQIKVFQGANNVNMDLYSVIYLRGSLTEQKKINYYVNPSLGIEVLRARLYEDHEQDKYYKISNKDLKSRTYLSPTISGGVGIEKYCGVCYAKAGLSYTYTFRKQVSEMPYTMLNDILRLYVGVRVPLE